jgi:hypothetical protein
VRGAAKLAIAKKKNNRKADNAVHAKRSRKLERSSLRPL